MQRERFYLDKFLTALQMKPNSVERGANPPDFLLTLEGSRIAVEVTEFHSATDVGGHPRRVVEEEWQKIQRLFEQERKQYPDLDNISGRLFFKQLEVPPSGKHKQFVKELLDFGRSVLGCLTKKGVDFSSFTPHFPLLNRYLKRLHLRDAGCHVTWNWNHSAGSVGLSEEELHGTISQKLIIFRPADVGENWLLVVSGHPLSQSMGRVSVNDLRGYQDLNKALEHGPYEKVYIFQSMCDRVLLWKRSEGWEEGA